MEPAEDRLCVVTNKLLALMDTSPMSVIQAELSELIRIFAYSVSELNATKSVRLSHPFDISVSELARVYESDCSGDLGHLF